MIIDFEGKGAKPRKSANHWRSPLSQRDFQEGMLIWPSSIWISDLGVTQKEFCASAEEQNATKRPSGSGLNIHQVSSTTLRGDAEMAKRTPLVYQQLENNLTGRSGFLVDRLFRGEEDG